MEEVMCDGRRLLGRLFYWLGLGIAACLWLSAAMAQSPTTTTVTDTVYQADGATAQGTIIITWPAFQTASGSPIAAGSTNVTIGSNGVFSVGLVTNVGATPAGVYYTVVYQLGPGQVRTEFWLVPTTSPANLAAVRTTPGSGIAAQPASIQFVNSALAAKANDNAVVHLANTETISGAKTFSASPSVPTPTSSGQVASKGYVDSAVSNVGAGNFLATAGGTMTGPITLPGSPSAPLQAATKSYVDTGLASKADLISGLVPTGELGTGLANSGSCLLGNGTWGACAAGGNLSTSPATSQAIAQPLGTQFSTNNLANIRYVTTSWNWAQTPADNLSSSGNLTIHLSPCPLGIDTASSSNNYVYRVYISGQGTPEAVTVTGGTCTPGATSGTITVTTANAHAAGYTVGSASTGIQEAWNDAWTTDAPISAASIAAPYVKLTAGTNYSVYSTIYLRGRGGMFDGSGAYIVCSTRDRCIYIGTPVSGIGYHKLYDVTGASTVNVDGAQVSSVSATSGTYTITTASNHPFVVGDKAACEYHSQTADQRWVSSVVSVPNATTFTVAFGTATFSAGGNTFGFCNILNTFIEDGSDHVALQDIQLTQATSAAGFFSYGVTDDNDQQFIIERAANRSSSVIKNTANWPMGAFFYQRTDQGNAGIMYIHNTELTNVNCADGGGNGFVMTDSVCQGFPVFGVRYFGGLQPSTFENVYEESTGGTVNPLYASSLPAQMGLLVQGGLGHRVGGTFPIAGWTPAFTSGGGSAAERNYFVIPRSSTEGYGPMWFIGSAQPSSGSVNINLQWPSIELQDGFAHQSLGTLTWDILVTTGTSPTPFGTGNFAVATNVSGSCSTGGICSYTDTQEPAAAYTLQTQQFFPVIWFWPSNVALNNTILEWDVGITSPAVVATQGVGSVAVWSPQCESLNPSYARSPVIVSCDAITNAFQSTVMPNMQGVPANSKGRLNLGQFTNAPNDLITLYDSNFIKTAATAGERPSADAGDIAMGADQVGGLSERAPTSITSYINTLASGTNYQERLTATGKTLNVPLTVNGGLSVSSGNVTLPVTGSGSQCLHVSSTGVLSGTGADCGSGSGSGSGTVNTGSTSQLALYSGNGAAVSGDSALSDNGTTLNYGGSGGIAAASGSFTGNLTVNGQLLVAGPWTVSSPVPGTSMAASGSGTSSLGISNDGNFYISANGATPQKVATSATSSFFTNVFQEDANDIGVFNGTSGQGVHVYGTYTNASNFERTGLAWDPTDNYFVIQNQNQGTGAQRGIGFWIGSSIRWAIDTASAFKPFLNNSFDVGVLSPSPLVPRTVYAGTSFDTLTQGRLNFELCNDGTTGTGLNFLAVYNGASPACAMKAGTSNTDGVIGVVSNGSGTTGNAVITYRGYVPCSFDGPTTAGDFVVASTSNPADCHDTGMTIRPIGVQVLGRAESTNSALGTYGVRLSLDAPIAGTFLDASQQPGSTLDVKLNNANALAITNGSATIDARSLGGAQTIAAEVSIGELRPPALSAVSGTSPGAGTYKLVYTLTSPTASETSASMESTITITGSQAIQFASPTYYGTATSYNVYMTPAGSAAVGTVNTSGTTVTWVSGSQFTTGTSWNGQPININGMWFTISSVTSATSLAVTSFVGTQSGVAYSTGNWNELKCSAATNVAIGTNTSISAACGGAAVSSTNKGFAVALIPPHTGAWTVTIADTVPNTSCGLKFFDEASLFGDHAGEGRPWYLVSTSSTNVEALACTDNNPKAGGGYYSIRGLSAHGTSSDSIQSAACVIRGMYDVSVFDDLQCTTNQSYPAAWVYAWGSGASTRISGSFEASSVGQPLVIGGNGSSIIAVNLHDISAVHPGNSYPNIAIRAGASSIHFSGTTYLEGPQTGSCSAPIQIATQNNVTGPIIFDEVHHGSFCSGATAPIFSVPSTFTVNDLTVGPVYTGQFTNLFTYTPNTALNISSVGTGTTHPGFTLDLNNPKVVLTNFQIAGTTALAAATAATPPTSDNSTNVATTAFVKNQSYATSASPALTGTPTAPTASAGDNSTKIATTAYVDGNYLPTSLAWGHNFNTATTVPFNTSTGHMNVFGIFVSQPVKMSQITVYVVTADNSSNTYDVGLFGGVSGSSNSLIAHTGAVAGSTYFGTAGAFTTIPFGSTVVLQPGRYYLALYANEASAPLALASNASSDVEFYHFNAATMTPASGGLAASFTGPADGYTTSAAPVFVLH
jgi:hypothetical protein